MWRKDRRHWSVLIANRYSILDRCACIAINKERPQPPLQERKESGLSLSCFRPLLLWNQSIKISDLQQGYCPIEPLKVRWLMGVHPIEPQRLFVQKLLVFCSCLLFIKTYWQAASGLNYGREDWKNVCQVERQAHGAMIYVFTPAFSKTQWWHQKYNLSSQIMHLEV